MGVRLRLWRATRRPRPLLRAALELVNAINGLHPLSRRDYFTLAVFAFGWPTSEMPALYMGASMADLVRRVRRGNLAGRRGKAAVALTAASWAVLAVIHRRGVRTPLPVLRSALRSGLGSDYADVVAALPTTFTSIGQHRIWGSIWARRRYVEKGHVIRYGPHGRANLADVWRRRDLPRDGKAPVVVQVPGGGWALGWRRLQAYPLMSHLADRGWVCVSLNYRASPRHTWPAHIVDVKRALAWVKENISAYGGDQDFVAITGGSSGGHLAALAALTPNEPQYQPGFADADTSVVAVVPVYGRYDWVSTDGSGRKGLMTFLQKAVVKKPLAQHLDIYIDASPIRRVRPDAPPFFVLHGEDDSIIPVGEARDFLAELRNVSRSPVLYAELPGAQHAFDMFGSPRANHSAEAIAQFLSWVYATTRFAER